MVTNQPLAATLWVKRGYRGQKVDTKTQTTKSQTQVDQGIQAKMDTSQTHISSLETQVAASVQALADDYLAQFSLEPTTRTQGKRNQKVRSLTSPSLTLYFFSIAFLLVCLSTLIFTLQYNCVRTFQVRAKLVWAHSKIAQNTMQSEYKDYVGMK